MKPSHLLAAAVLLCAGAAPAAAQQTVYKCSTPTGGVVFSDGPCAEGREISSSTRNGAVVERHASVPQDRARLQNRSLLTAQVQGECSLLESRMRSEEAMLRTKPQPVTPADEKVWLQSKLRFRELRC
jgi:hypothetical protein